MPGPLPRRGLPAGFAHDGVRQRADEPTLLRNGNESPRADDGAIRTHPARQRFTRFDAAGGEINLGLEIGTEFVAFEGAAHLAFERQAGDRLAVERLRVELETRRRSV